MDKLCYMYTHNGMLYNKNKETKATKLLPGWVYTAPQRKCCPETSRHWLLKGLSAYAISSREPTTMLWGSPSSFMERPFWERLFTNSSAEFPASNLQQCEWAILELDPPAGEYVLPLKIEAWDPKNRGREFPGWWCRDGIDNSSAQGIRQPVHSW